MLRRIYIDNFKCFVNFEFAVESVNLFLGPNGSGKSGIFETLRKIQCFISGEGKVGDIFSPDEYTRWQNSPIQYFEIDVGGKGGVFRYEIAVEYEPEENLMQVRHERLWFDSRPLITFESGDLKLYRDDHLEASNFRFGRDQSAVALIPSGRDNRLLTWFKKYMQEKLIVLKIDPTTMVSESEQEDKHPSVTMDNFASWYRHISQDQGKAIEITNNLKEILDGFNNFKFAEAGRTRRALGVNFHDASEGKRPVEYQFHELSDGQRMLIVLYTLIYTVRSEGVTLCMDEPENFLALPEIQPWLVTLYDLCGDGEIQALLASHHPQMIDCLSLPSGYWFERQCNGPVRVRRITENNESGLPVSKLVARGWLYYEQT